MAGVLTNVYRYKDPLPSFQQAAHIREICSKHLDIFTMLTFVHVLPQHYQARSVYSSLNPEKMILHRIYFSSVFVISIGWQWAHAQHDIYIPVCKTNSGDAGPPNPAAIMGLQPTLFNRPKNGNIQVHASIANSSLLFVLAVPTDWVYIYLPTLAG